ncbi:hypothetical protein C4559_05525 [Candidatus Microgenomates bacterium]|nr:MAG: hypothetical protein C4559_05525 [Candidatus Microgenomates bacterium]
MQNEFEKYYNYSLRYLTIRSRSEKEIRDYLKKKKVSPETIEKITSKLKEHNFINDEEFAKWWIGQRISFKQRAFKVIKIELQQKGITSEIIEDQISIRQLADKNQKQDLGMAQEIVQKKISKYKNFPKQEIYQKLGRVLSQKGFNWDVIKQSIDEALKGEYNT